MGKKRNAKKKSYGGGSTSSNSKDDRFSSFEFTEDDLRVEFESHKTLAKFGAKTPGKKSLHHRTPVDKYVFLEFFAQGPINHQKDSGNEMSDVDVADTSFQGRSFGTDVTISLGSLNYEPKPSSFPKSQGLKCSCGEKPHASRSRKPGYYKPDKHNKILYVDSDEDGGMKLRSLSSLYLSENEDSLKEQSSEYGANNIDCEPVVAVSPYYVKYGKIYYTRCLLTFSQRCVRLEGSPLCDRKRTHSFEWSTSDILHIEHQQCESVKVDIVNLLMKHKDTGVLETGNWNSGSVELEFVVVDDPRWSKTKEEIKSLDLKYEVAWKTIVSECSFKESFENMVYPDGDPDAVFISRRDIELLQPRTFINDTIIDFYLKYLSNKIKPEEQHRFHFFNTFFFQKLHAVYRDSSRDCEGRGAFKNLRKWTRNVNIFETDYIFIPINFSLHWSLIIICNPGEIANLRDKVVDKLSKIPCILHMDSIRGSHGGFEDLIRSYLWEEWIVRENKYDEDIPMKNLEFVSLQLPQQENLFDCGLFLLHYAELFLEQASNFSATKYFDILNEDWFLPAEVSLRKRDYIKKLIHKIVEDNATKDPRAACDNTYLEGFGMNEGDKGHQSSVTMLEQMSGIDNYQLQVPINQFNNLSLPMEEAFKRQTTIQQADITSRYHIDTLMSPCCQLSDSRTGEIKDSSETCKSCSDKSVIIIDVQRDKDRCDDTSMLSEDLEACVVEDSEDESGTESIPRGRVVV